MKVRAKFKVTQINKDIEAKTGTVILEPVIGGSDENKAFFRYTPSGRIQMNILNESAINQFKLGNEYYVDFTPAE